jgi:hypothetical protein
MPTWYCVTYGCDDSNVGQVTASSLRMIGHNHLTFVPVVSHSLDLIFDGLLHGTKMYGQVRRVGYESTVRLYDN